MHAVEHPLPPTSRITVSSRTHVTSYGVSVTTLEEVFLKVASDATDHKSLGRLGQLRREISASVMGASQGVEENQVSCLTRSGHSASCGSPWKVHRDSISLPKACVGYELLSCLDRTHQMQWYIVRRSYAVACFGLLDTPPPRTGLATTTVSKMLFFRPSFHTRTSSSLVRAA